jgi:endoglucanase
MMPHEANSQRYVVQKSTAAALDFAAVCAKAARVLKPWADQLPGLADSCRRQAVEAWDWSLRNPDVLYQQPSDISTGAYGDDNLKDEWYWAACELFLTEKESKYMEAARNYYQTASVPAWGNVGMLGTISLISSPVELPESLNQLNIEAGFFNLVDELVRRWEESPFRVSIDYFEWGSNSTVANEGMLKLIALKKTGDQKYFSAALSDLDYILGRNATGYCFVTGFGQKKVMNIHHRPSEADGIEDPVPGFLAGGPNLATFDDCPSAERSQFPAKSYIDDWCSYSTNEIAINWNAPLLYLSGGINSIKN